MKGYDIALGAGVRSAIIHSNLSGDGLDIKNAIGNRAIIQLNEPKPQKKAQTKPATQPTKP